MPTNKQIKRDQRRRDKESRRRYRQVSEHKKEQAKRRATPQPTAQEMLDILERDDRRRSRSYMNPLGLAAIVAAVALDEHKLA